MRIYLAGPIFGCDESGACDWRDWFKTGRIAKTFAGSPEWIDPMKRDYRGVESVSYREIVELDKRDILSCDFVVVMYSKPSVGTSMEVLFAWENGIPVLTINKTGAGVSPWLKYHSTAIVESNEEAAAKLIGWM